jgi:osmotically-inducible protein OsmY
MMGAALLFLVAIAGIDAEVADAVSAELALDEELVRSSIEVAVEEGVVTLTGAVPSLFLKQRASDVTELVRGVRAVVNRIQVEAPPFSDAALRSEVSRALAENYGSPLPGQIGIAADQGLVVLTGLVPSLRDRNLIEERVREVRGVRALDDRLQIERLPAPTDRDLESALEAVLRWDSELGAADIVVRIESGRARLRGTVENAAEKSRAIHLAGIPGVTAVDASELTLAPRGGHDRLKRQAGFVASDREIEAAVEDALFYDPRVRAFKVTVTAEEGMVVLQGEVESLEGKLAAEEDAASVSGVLGFENQLVVRPRATRPDAAVAGSIELDLRHDPYLEGAEKIVVSVSGGVVHLYGAVDTALQRERAGRLASKVPGAVEVQNHLDVVRLDFPGRKPDAEVRTAIRENLRRSTLLDLDDLEVEVEDGMATLTGEAPSLVARRAASREAFQGGAVLVKNQLEVKPDGGAESDEARR